MEVNELIKQFAKDHRLRATKDECDDVVILGKVGHLYEYSDTELGVMFISKTKTPTRSKWEKIRQRLLDAGMTLRQNGDDEGAFSFDPQNPGQVAAALGTPKIRRRKELSPERRAAQIAVLAAARAARTSISLSKSL